ncbi:hypothetical protein [Halobacillus karajensis]|uniref:Capsule polysaccharide biosynthesis protein n=1 Tax=Halobacillus karajensis TaxID=195088 RepID=A0A024P520_9BACI|nr:hypothetical protein [Halobacillus karajensis]CDQ20652.1 Capsule polysaccharide biosynthesis protein [Halobacillus karajensis]CDQ23878.1 Capsule polysaccharide biosynthesis protein [Halobacillus karajensis]CDQ27356.1 Capsule polysaccharide biosynthesis protein [Halobacillus karajensis]
MDTFERNFWSLYLEFIETFQEVKYKGISIPYLCHFRSLFTNNEELKKNLSTDAFIHQLSHKVKDKRSFQQRFTDFKNLHLNKQMERKANGKVALYNAANLLRFPTEITKKHFKPDCTLVIRDIRGKRTSKNPVTAEGLPAHYLNDYDESIDGHVTAIQKQAEGIIAKHKKHPLFDHPTFKVALNNQIDRIAHRIVESYNMIAKLPISCIVFSSTHYYQSRTLAVVAAKHNIPTICMQHGIVASENGYMPKIADVDAVYGYFEVNWFKSIGVSSEGVKVVGHPRFDLISKDPKMTKKALFSKLGLDHQKKTILLIVRGNAYMKYWRKLLDSLEKFGSYNVIIKDFPVRTPHPLTENYTFAFSSKSYHLYDLLPHVDVVVAYLSTVGLEAMIAGKPVFLLSTPAPTYSGYYDRLGRMIQDDPQGLANIVHRYFNNEEFRVKVNSKRKKFLSYAYPNGKTSSQKLMDLITEMTKS